MTASKKIYWIDINRFDTKINKGDWVEMVYALESEGYEAEILTGYAKEKYRPENGVNIRYFRALNLGFFFRYTLLLNILFWILLHGGRSDIYIIPPNALLIAPWMRLFGKKNIHLDIRSFHVDIHTIKDRLGNFLFWTVPLRLFGWIPKGFSFITERLRIAVEEDVNLGCTKYVIWQSGVSTLNFNPVIKQSSQGDKFKLFYHGTVSDNRGVYRVIQAISILDEDYRKNLLFVVVGSGSGYENLSVVAKQEGVTDLVELRGRVPYERIPSEISDADVCVCPLPRLPEWDMSSPLKVMEYMAAARPMILTPIPAHQDVLGEEEFVVWCDSDSVDDIAKAIKFAMDNRDRLSRAALTAPDVVKENFEWSSHARKLSEYLKETF